MLLPTNSPRTLIVPFWKQNKTTNLFSYFCSKEASGKMDCLRREAPQGVDDEHVEHSVRYMSNSRTKLQQTWV